MYNVADGSLDSLPPLLHSPPLSLSPSVLPLLEVVACSKGHQVGIVCRSGIGYTAGAAHIRVAELVSEALKFICCEIIVIP